MYIYIYIVIYSYVCVYIYIYIYIFKHITFIMAAAVKVRRDGGGETARAWRGAGVKERGRTQSHSGQESELCAPASTTVPERGDPTIESPERRSRVTSSYLWLVHCCLCLLCCMCYTLPLSLSIYIYICMYIYIYMCVCIYIYIYTSL